MITPCVIVAVALRSVLLFAAALKAVRKVEESTTPQFLGYMASMSIDAAIMAAAVSYFVDMAVR